MRVTEYVTVKIYNKKSLYITASYKIKWRARETQFICIMRIIPPTNYLYTTVL